MTQVKKVYIVAAKRTAIGTFAGSLKDTSAIDLGVVVAKELIKETRVSGSTINEVIFGNVLSAGLGQNVARQIAIKAGIPCETPSYTVNKVCGSGLKAVQLACQAIASGEAQVVLAGGTENMNQAPYLVKGARFGLRLNDSVMVDSMVKDGLWCAINDYHMGVTAENLAVKYGISRKEQDEFAALSHAKAILAIAQGAFVREIVAIPIRKQKETTDFKVDEHPRPDSTLEKLSRLSPAFKKDGTVTAGNSSGINDGAAGLLLAGEEYVQENNLVPLAEIIGFASAGVAPEIMGMGAAAALQKVLQKTNMTLAGIDVFELNEAFAAQSLAVMKELKLDQEKVNVHGGAVALGHPIGASGARIMVTLLYAMQGCNAKTGLAAICIGGGMGMAVIIKNI